jgi:hypothetical protein
MLTAQNPPDSLERFLRAIALAKLRMAAPGSAAWSGIIGLFSVSIHG